MKKLFLILTLSAPLLLMGIGPKSISFTWANNPPDDQVIEYRVYERTGSNYVFLGTSKTNFFSLASVVPGKHVYSVTASNYWGEGAFSNEDSTPNAPGTINTFTIVK